MHLIWQGSALESAPIWMKATEANLSTDFLLTESHHLKAVWLHSSRHKMVYACQMFYSCASSTLKALTTDGLSELRSENNWHQLNSDM